MRKIVIVSLYYKPIQNPRSFRTTELAKELSRRGYAVTVFNCSQIEGFDYSTYDNDGIKLINISGTTVKSLATANSKRNNLLLNKIAKILFFFTTNSLWKIYRKINKQIIFEEKFDVLVSIGLPFHVHWAVGRKIKGNNIANVYIADYGDPFSRYNPTARVAPYFRFIEKRIINKFDYITVPTNESVNSYLWLKKENKIKVIPQGFDIKDVAISKYIRNDITTFAFAGRFYPKTRDPKFFFEYLIGLKSAFKFVLYTPTTGEGFELIKPYIKQLKDKVEVRKMVDRENLLFELSKMDFLINFDNVNSNQTPSKLIDYSLSKRPILSFSSRSFDSDDFTAFLHGNYQSMKKINLSDYDINTVTDQFESLFI